MAIENLCFKTLGEICKMKKKIFKSSGLQSLGRSTLENGSGEYRNH